MQNKKDWALEQRYAEESYTELVARLNTPTEVQNPEAQKQILAPIDLKQVRKEVTDTEALAVLNSNIWKLTLEALKVGDSDAVKSNLAAMVAGELISAASAKKLGALLNKTIPDPTYKPLVKLSPCQINNFSPLTIEELQ